MKEIQIQTESIKLGQFLKFVGVISIGSAAKEFLESNVVKVNLKVEKQRGRKLFDGDLVEIEGVKYLVKVQKCK